MSVSVSKTHVSEEVRNSYPMVTRLIEEVRKRPQLWNPNHYLHHTRPLIGDNWEEIASVIGSPSKLFTNSRLLSMSNASLTPANLVKTKWKGLRDNFRKEVKKCLRLGDAYIPWIHFKACSFLWSVLDTSQLDGTPEQIAELKKRYGGDNDIDLDAYEPYDYRYIENPTNDDDDSMDFHDFIFADEVPVGELLKQAQEDQLKAGFDPNALEEGEIITGDNDEEGDIQIIEPIIEQVEVPDDDDDEETEPQQKQQEQPPTALMPTLKITEPRSLNKPPLKKFVPLRIVKKVPGLPELTPLPKSATDPSTVVPNKKSDTIPKKNDSDLHFLKSVLPYLKQINSKRKSRIKEEIREMLLDEINKNESQKKQKLDTSNALQIAQVVRNGTTVKAEDEASLSS